MSNPSPDSTIPYMSHERVSGKPDDLDTRRHVYALGIIAYKLLTGQMPYDLQQKMIHEAVRSSILEDESKYGNRSLSSSLASSAASIRK